MACVVNVVNVVCCDVWASLVYVVCMVYVVRVVNVVNVVCVVYVVNEIYRHPCG